MTDILLKPISKVNGQITLPGSKSLSNRILLLSALAQGTTAIANLLHSDDTAHMLNALAQLGVNYTLSSDKTACQITGASAIFPVKTGRIFVGNSGTTVRFLTAALSAMEGNYQLDGIARMRERPIKDLVDALRQAGGKINYLQNEGYPPLEIAPSRLSGGKIKIRGDISSQFVTALLMAVPLSGEETVIEIEGELVSQPYVDMTIKTMAQFGVTVENENFTRFIIPAGQRYVSPEKVFIEGDASSATYFLSAGAIGGGTVRVNGVGKNSLQGDARFADLLGKMGASVRKGETWLEVSRGQLKGINRDLSDMPDAAMTLAVTALFAEGTTTIRNIYNWRVKETDRLTAMATELRKLGAEVEEGEDYLRITPPTHLQSAAIDTYDDHRIAMSFSLAALGNVEVLIKDKECTAKTFPDYFERLAEIVA